MRRISRVFRVLLPLSLLAAHGCAARPTARSPLAYPQLGARAPATASPAPSTTATIPAAPTSASIAPPLGVQSSVGPFGDAPFASEGPLLLEAAASDGRWVAVCQARKDSDGDGKRSVSFGARGEARGDALTRFLIAPSAEIVIDGLLSSSGNGRYALVLQRGALVLWDSQSRQALNLSALGADARLSAESFSELRTAAFDANSERLLYVRTGSEGRRVIVRSLLDGSERELDPGSGPIWRARFAPSGTFAVLEMMTQDSNKNGRADFPAPVLNAPRACAASPGHFHAFVDRGDRPELVLLPLDGSAALHEPDLVMPVADALLLRDSTSALWLERAGKKRLLEPADCKGRIVHADALRELFIIGCAQKKKTGRVSLELVTRTERKPLGLELASVELDRELSDSPRLLALYPGSDTVLFDADHRDLHPLQPGDVVIATRAGRALVRRGKTPLIYDADTHAEQPLPFTLDKYPDVLVNLPFAFVSPVLINLDVAQVVGTSQARPLALSNGGQLLLTEGETAPSGLVSGGLRWFTPGL
ncbi:MAG: hypothetical protein ABW061_22435 [Polyangiaceae bacterium]